MDDIKTFHFSISGKVQGVWYRASAKDKALSLGLQGKVWNKKNGDVGAIVQGTMEKINQFATWCKKGPPLARVEEVKMERLEEDVRYNDFVIGSSPESPE